MFVIKWEAEAALEISEISLFKGAAAPDCPGAFAKAGKLVLSFEILVVDISEKEEEDAKVDAAVAENDVALVAV